MDEMGCIAFCFGEQSQADPPFDWFKLILLPVALFALQQLIVGVSQARQKYRRQFALVENVVSEIERTLKINIVQYRAFSKALTDGTFAGKVAADPKYYIYTASGAAASPIFKPDADDFFFLSKQTSDTIVGFYESQALIHASFESLKGDPFRELDAARKLDALRKIAKALAEANALARRATKLLTKARNSMLVDPLRCALFANGR